MCLTSCDPYLDDVLGHWERPTNNAGGGGEGGASETSISLDKANLRFVKTDLTAQTLKATVTPSDAEVTWTSSDEAVATVANGVVTPVAPGEAIITAKAGDKTVTSNVYVYDKIYDLSSGYDVVTTGQFWLIEGINHAGLGIGDGAKITLNDINMDVPLYCQGDATIIIADGSNNVITAPDHETAIQAISGDLTKTLTIKGENEGTGKLTATGGAQGAGIGTRYMTSDNANCGPIVINGGIITATGGTGAAGIGTAEADGDQKCASITINGGTIIATGGANAAAIGTGYANGAGKTQNCGAITIGSGVTSVTATKGGDGATNSIGLGGSISGGTQTSGGAITIGGVDYGIGVTTSPFTYAP